MTSGLDRDICSRAGRDADVCVGKRWARPDAVADQLYAALARGRDLRRLVSIIGEAALSERDRSYLAFAHDFEQSFVNQGGDRRAIEETLELAWKLLLTLPEADLKRIDPELQARYGHREDRDA